MPEYAFWAVRTVGETPTSGSILRVRMVVQWHTRRTNKVPPTEHCWLGGTNNLLKEGMYKL